MDERENKIFLKSHSLAFQSGWLRARDGGEEEIITGNERTIQDYIDGHQAFREINQVHCPEDVG